METINLLKQQVFQTDSKIVQQVYQNNNNYLIEFDTNGDKDYCAIYFCSNDIYFPNNEAIFRKRIIEKNFFEWYHSRIKKAGKHIFIRDVFKQWYLSGINQYINTPDKLLSFLKEETKGYKIITIGSSAGGYAAILYGSLLQAQKVLAFNPQFELESLLKRSSENRNPLIFRIKDERTRYFNIIPYINKDIDIFYFYSNASQWDIEQYKQVKSYSKIHKIAYNSRHHGIPFLKVALPITINLEENTLIEFSKKSHNPIFFTIQMVGVRRTIQGFIQQAYQAYKKRRK